MTTARVARRKAYRQRVAAASVRANRAFDDARIVEPGQREAEARRVQMENAIAKPDKGEL
jgi:hypothetical protein